MLKLMRRTFLMELGLVCLLTLTMSPRGVQAGPAPSGGVYFTPNQGQWADSILFRGQAPGGTLWFTRTRVYYHFTREVDTTKTFRSSPKERAGEARGFAHAQTRVEHLLVSTELTGSPAVAMTVVGEGEPLGRSNYFLGNDRTRWKANLPDFPSLVYQNVYPGIDLRYRNANGRLEYDFLVAPGADPSVIQMRLSGKQSLQLGTDGRLALQTAWGSVKQDAPRVYYMSGSDTTWISARFVQTAAETFGFSFDRSAPADLALVIDPTIQLCTYLGGSSDDVGSIPNGTRPSICVDDNGEIILTGYTTSSDFPVINAYDGALGGSKDFFVTKLNPSGAVRVFSTYIGGSSDEYSFAVAVDNSDNVYVAGTVFSSDFPTVNAAQSFQAGSGDACLIKLAADGSSILYSTYYGGSIGTDWGTSMAIDPLGNRVIVGGGIYSPTLAGNFPTTAGVIQTAWGGPPGDGFVMGFNPHLSGASSLLFATFLGGSGDDGTEGVGLSPGGDLCVVGVTSSIDFPGAVGSLQGNSDGFYARLSVDGTTLFSSTLFGGGAYDNIIGLSFDASIDAYLTGYTFSSLFTTTAGAADQVFNGPSDAFVIKLPVVGGSPIYTTFLGGLGNDEGRFIRVDPAGRAIVTGYTFATQFPEILAVQNGPAGMADAFLTVLNPDGSGFDFSSYLGGTGNDWARGLALNPAGDMVIVGYTESIDLPVTGGGYDPSYNGSGDAFVVQVGNIDLDYDLVLNDDDNCPQDANFSQNDADLDGLGNVCDACILDPDNDADGDGDCGNVDNCPATFNPLQEDGNANNIGDACEMSDPFTAEVYSPVDLIITDSKGDSIGIGFNTIGLGSSYDTTLDINSAALTGPDGDPDDRITIPVPLAGSYSVRLAREAGASDSAKFTLAIRINGNQQLIPDGYRDASVSALGTTLPATYVWVASTILTGDFNADGNYTSADIILLVNQAFKSGPPPDPASVSDVNCSGAVTSADIIIMVNYVFKSGPPPCSGSAG